jgi:2-polyprenyl-6-hydroxyphenyl methylase/3-demethylubiquinone-9 3-methyltransferase
MEFMHNIIDWVGGYPYEYADPDEFIQFVCSFGFECKNLFPAKVPTGCNEFVFKKILEDNQTNKD